MLLSLLLDRSRANTPSNAIALQAKPSIVGMTTSAFDPASRVRFIQFVPYLERAGWQVSHCPNRPDRQWSSPLRGRLSRALHHRTGRVLMKVNRLLDIRNTRHHDVIFVNRDLAGGGLIFEKQLLRGNHRVIFDFDDAIFIGKNEPAVRWMCQHAAWVTPGNDYLADYARQYSDRVTVIPTVVDTDNYAIKANLPSGSNRLVRVGWSGSDQSIQHTLFPYLKMLEQVQEKLHFEFVIITNSKPSLPVSRLRWTFCKWSADGERDLARQMDIGLMPLLDNDFQRGKCGLKLLQYMAAGIPTIASPVGVNSSITQRGRTGFLAATDEEWRNALETLVRSPSLRIEMGQAGRQLCEEQYSIRRWLPSILGIFDTVRKMSQPYLKCR